MSFDDTITRSIEDHVDGVVAPPADLAAIRRSGRRHRAVTTAAASIGVLAVLTGGFALATSGSDPTGTQVGPSELPAMDFDHGLRAYYDDINGELHMGGQVFALSNVPNLDTSSWATPHGVAYVDDGDVRLLTEDGKSRLLTSEGGAPGGNGDAFGAVVFDAATERLAWLTRREGEVFLVEHEFVDAASETQVWTEVPCEGRECEMLTVAGFDQGMAFVGRLDRDETLVFGGDDVVTLEGFRVADARNGVVLGMGALPAGDPLGKGWRFAEAQGPESLLTFDGAHELYWSSTLRSTAGGAPLRLDVPAKGAEFVNLDSDGSVLVAVTSGGGPQRYFDCEVPSGECTPIGTLKGTSGDPIFLGNDM
ncbi:hypothetical protein [Nocardioides sp.]|uniref:hypothetical protein n=1 Tax=Nocardioides sp. TaxID=35761 RepID=UPI002ED3E530